MSKKKSVKTISLLWVGSIMGAGCAFLTQALLARELGPVEFGAFATAFAMVSLLVPIAGFGVAPYWLKVFGQEGWGAIRFFPSSFRFVLISTLCVIMALIGWAAFGPHDESFRLIIVILSAYVFGQVSLELVSSKFQLEERYFQLALWQFLPHFVRLALVIILIFWLTDGGSVANVAYAYAVVAIGLLMFGFFSLSKMSNGDFDLKGHTKLIAQSNEWIPDIKTVILHSWPFGLAGVFHLIYFQSDIILVKYITGLETAGVYNVAFTIMVAVLLFPGIVYQKFLLPKMHRWANHDRERFYLVYKQGNLIMLILGIVAMLLIWIIAPWVVPFIFGEAYQEAISLLMILAVSAPILFIASSVGATLVTQSHMKTKVKLMGLVAILNIILNLVLIPDFGSEGAAVSTVISNAFLLLIYFIAAENLVFKKEGVGQCEKRQ
ncbi:MAG: flippase [Colwelliaceae bacterium]|nr:flippase [Colwelliaceae bacterium]